MGVGASRSCWGRAWSASASGRSSVGRLAATGGISASCVVSCSGRVKSVMFAGSRYSSPDTVAGGVSKAETTGQCSTSSPPLSGADGVSGTVGDPGGVPATASGVSRAVNAISESRGADFAGKGSAAASIFREAASTDPVRLSSAPSSSEAALTGAVRMGFEGAVSEASSSALARISGVKLAVAFNCVRTGSDSRGVVERRAPPVGCVFGTEADNFGTSALLTTGAFGRPAASAGSVRSAVSANFGTAVSSGAVADTGAGQTDKSSAQSCGGLRSAVGPGAPVVLCATAGRTHSCGSRPEGCCGAAVSSGESGAPASVISVEATLLDDTRRCAPGF